LNFYLNEWSIHPSLIVFARPTNIFASQGLCDLTKYQRIGESMNACHTWRLLVTSNNVGSF
jgi:hypothetical protein